MANQSRRVCAPICLPRDPHVRPGALITVREHARLTLEGDHASLDRATIPPSAFGWLATNLTGAATLNGAVALESPRTLRALNHVGVIETPCGTRIEILPKHVDGSDDPARARRALVGMIAEALDLTPLGPSQSSIAALDTPLPEWLAERFLEAVTTLTRRGLRRQYRRVEADLNFLRGAINASAQLRAGPARAHRFQARHDEFTLDRAENRLIKTAIDRIARETRSNENWRRARELALLLDEIPRSRDVPGDMRAWSDERALADYANVRTLCELIVGGRAPLAVVGAHDGLSMLFPMQRVFEILVTNALRRAAPSDLKVRAQNGDRHLCEYDGGPMFRLRPDLMVEGRGARWVIDAKWKTPSGSKADAFGLAQADLYQMHAYGHRHLGGDGDMFLVYPRTLAFHEPLGPFHFSNTLRLWGLPFDLERRAAPYPFLSASGVGHRVAA